MRASSPAVARLRAGRISAVVEWPMWEVISSDPVWVSLAQHVEHGGFLQLRRLGTATGRIGSYAFRP